jgi:uroporphyrinogen-III decarboxylase
VRFLIKTLDRCFSEVEVDLVVIGEDMAGRNGPLISPAMFREFMMPYYKRFTAFCRDHGVGTIWVDSDGDIRKLIPLWIESGVNGIGPCDNVLGQVDVVELREAFPRLVMAGGIDKRIIEEGRTFAEIDAELEHKVRPLVRRGGYFPGPDHAWTPQASLENYMYYIDKLNEICQNL